MEAVGGIGERGGPVAARFGFMEMWMEDDLCASPRGPADRFRIAPRLVADGEAEGHCASREDASLGAGFVKRIFGRVELHLVLPPRDGAVAIDDKRRDHRASVHQAFGAEEHANIRPTRCRGDVSIGAVEEPRIRRSHLMIRRAVAWHIALWKADQVHALTPRVVDCGEAARERVVGEGCDFGVGHEPQCTRRAHALLFRPRRCVGDTGCGAHADANAAVVDAWA